MNSEIIHTHFDVEKEAPRQRLLAWRERVSHVMDVVPTRADLERPFDAAIDRYEAGDLAMTFCRSDELRLDRSIARVSTDRIRTFAFHVFFSGRMVKLAVHDPSSRGRDISDAAIVVLDLNEPVRMLRSTCEVLTFFVPSNVVESIFPYPDALHGRALADTTPLTRLIIEHARTLNIDLPKMSAASAQQAIRQNIELMVSAFGKQAQLTGSARAAGRAAIFAQVRHYIQANVDRAELSPESIVAALRLSRPTVYRLFQHEGGLGAYIRHLRLRHAANDLARFPNISVTEIAFGLGFNSLSDFTRAFRRAYDMAPQDFRIMSNLTA